ncbi:hypothetical protein AVEN_255877-1 [Araneus ventricosus]|uniref:Uncharacterized protein n=1 Tax=Araneus ventricosus TaxID=182803 RepID=A0A4Y2DGW4_ARAVE|nr:hypothetical protein AVEN_255877-1 [Araneus ventricosus]
MQNELHCQVHVGYRMYKGRKITMCRRRRFRRVEAGSFQYRTYSVVDNLASTTRKMITTLLSTAGARFHTSPGLIFHAGQAEAEMDFAAKVAVRA